MTRLISHSALGSMTTYAIANPEGSGSAKVQLILRCQARAARFPQSPEKDQPGLEARFRECVLNPRVSIPGVRKPGSFPYHWGTWRQEALKLGSRASWATFYASLRPTMDLHSLQSFHSFVHSFVHSFIHSFQVPRTLRWALATSLFHGKSPASVLACFPFWSLLWLPLLLSLLLRFRFFQRDCSWPFG